VNLRHLALCGGFATLVFGSKLSFTCLVLVLRLAFALFEPALEQHVVNHTYDRVAQFPQVIAVQGDLRVGPQLVEIVGIR
jgi:hypothetical protein